MKTLLPLLFVTSLAIAENPDPPEPIEPDPVLVATVDLTGDGQLDEIFETCPGCHYLRAFADWQMIPFRIGQGVSSGVSVFPEWTPRDVDGDRLPDLRTITSDGEVIWFLQTNPDEFWIWLPLRSDTTEDHDKDGLNLFGEAEAGTSDRNPDTDGDTLPDGWEHEHGRNPLVADLGYFDELKTRAFPSGEPSIEIDRDRSVIVSGLYPAEGLQIVVQVSEDLQTWRDGGTAEDAVSGVLEFTSPLPGGFVVFGERGIVPHGTLLASLGHLFQPLSRCQ